MENVKKIVEDYRSLVGIIQEMINGVSHAGCIRALDYVQSITITTSGFLRVTHYNESTGPDKLKIRDFTELEIAEYINRKGK